MTRLLPLLASKSSAPTMPLSITATPTPAPVTPYFCAATAASLEPTVNASLFFTAPSKERCATKGRRDSEFKLRDGARAATE